MRRACRDGAPGLMEEVVSRENLTVAYRRVVRNKGEAGASNRPCLPDPALNVPAVDRLARTSLPDFVSFSGACCGERQ